MIRLAFKLMFWLGFERRDIGDYMSRWILTLPGGATIRLHHIRRPDADPELHDHPWSFVSVVLKGWYLEERAGHQLLNMRYVHTLPSLRDGRSLATAILKPNGSLRTYVGRRRCSVAYRSAESPHRIDSVSPGGVWTLVLSGPRRREWGFWTRQGWVSWREFKSVKPGEVHHADGTVTGGPA